MSSLAEAPTFSDRAVVGAYDPWRRPPQSFTYRPPHSHSTVGFELLRAQWFRPVVHRLADLMRLPRNWDSYGGVAVTEAYATHALWFLARFLEPGSVAPWVVPLSDGGVQFEWHREGIDIDLIFSPEQGNEASVRDELHAIEWEGAAEDLLRESASEVATRAVTALRAA